LRFAAYCGFDFRISERDYRINGHFEDANASGADGKSVLEDLQTEFNGEFGEEGELGERLLDFGALCDRITGIICLGDVCGCLVYGSEEDYWSCAVLC
jgi:hypothetical protein